jgi:hypothetical protein
VTCARFIFLHCDSRRVIVRVCVLACALYLASVLWCNIIRKMAGRIARFLGAQTPAEATPIVVLHLNLAVYACSFWMSQPVLPFITKGTGCGPLLSALTTELTVAPPRRLLSLLPQTLTPTR